MKGVEIAEFETQGIERGCLLRGESGGGPAGFGFDDEFLEIFGSEGWGFEV